jgi:hypothetical protein
MKHIVFAVLLPAFLAGCGGSNPFEADTDTGTGGDATEVVVINDLPDAIAGNLNRIQYDPDTETLLVDMYALDASPELAAYTRTASLDLNEFTAYQVNESNLQRTFTAMVKQAPRGTVFAAIVADGGQFNRTFGGGYYQRNGDYTPHTGLVSYAGDYVGLYTPGAGINDPNIPDEFETQSNYRVTGEILINASFSDNAVNGGIIERQILDDTGAFLSTLESVALAVAEIDANGEFLGDIEFLGTPDEPIGAYGGIFGGTDASDIAGILLFNPVLDEGQIWENGAFVLGQCGLAGDAALCDEG